MKKRIERYGAGVLFIVAAMLIGASDVRSARDDSGDHAVGLPGIQRVERVDFSSKNDSEEQKKAFASCPEGKKVIGGGGKIFIGEPDTVKGPIALKASYPSEDQHGWAVTAEEVAPTALKWYVTAYAICARVVP